MSSRKSESKKSSISYTNKRDVTEERYKCKVLSDSDNLRLEFLKEALRGKVKAYEYRTSNDLSPISAQTMIEKSDHSLSIFIIETPNYVIFNELWLNICKEGLYTRIEEEKDIDLPEYFSPVEEQKFISMEMEKGLKKIGYMLGLELVKIYYEKDSEFVESDLGKEEVNRSWAIFKKG